MTDSNTVGETDPRLAVHFERSKQYRTLLGAGVTALEATAMIPQTPHRGIVFEDIPVGLRQTYVDLAAYYGQ